MLKFFNRLEKTRNFVLLVFGILMVLSLVLFYAPTRNNVSENLATSQDVAAKVSGEKITVGELYRQKQDFSERFGGSQSFPAKLIINQLIGSRIARVEAARLGLTASDQEVRNAICEQMRSEGTSCDKDEDRKQYEDNVTQKFGSVSAYEESVRDQLSAQKLEAFLTSGVTVSEEEVLNDFKKKNTKFDLSYVVVDPTELAKTISPTDTELKDYFEKNKASYYISVPQKKIKYVFVNTAKIGEKLQISDADLKAEYDKLPPDKKIGGVLGQEIVIRIDKPNDQQSEQQASAKAADIEARLKKNGATVSEEDFANVAKGYSQNPATASLGGKLSGPVRENPNKPDDPYQKLLKMKPGEVTDPITYQGRIFILRRGDDVPKSFEDAKKELDVSLRNRRAYAAASDLASKIADELKQNKDPQKTASDFASQANMSVADMIRETPYVKPGDNVDKIGVSQQFEDGIKDLNNPQDVGDKTPVPEGFAVPLLVDQKPPRDADFDEVKAQIVESVKLDKARAEVQDIADQIASGSANADALAALATSKGLKAQDQKSFILGTPLGQGPSATTNDALEDAIYAMKTGDVTKTPIQLGDNWVIVGVKNRQDASMDDYAKQKDDLMEQMLQQKRNTVFTDYMSATKQKMETDGKIVLYPDAIAKVDAPDLPGGEDQQ